MKLRDRAVLFSSWFWRYFWIAILVIPVLAMPQFASCIQDHKAKAHPVLYIEGVNVINPAKNERVPESVAVPLWFLAAGKDGYRRDISRRYCLGTGFVGGNGSFSGFRVLELLILKHLYRFFIIIERTISVDIVDVNSYILCHCCPS